MKRMLPVIVVVGSVALLGACKSDNPVNTVEPQNRRAQPAIAESRHVVMDKSLANRLTLRQVNTGKATGDLMKVQALLENSASDAITVNYQWVWYDNEGMALASPMSVWSPIKIRGGETVALVSVAPKPTAVDYQLKLTRGR